MEISVVDSSVWIDFFNKKTTPQIEIVKSSLYTSTKKSPFGIMPIIYQEILQGIDNDKQYALVKEVLLGLEMIDIDQFLYAEKAADLYRYLRRKGVTIRKANDCLIAAVCIDFKYPIIHNDKDFDNIAKYTSLKIYK
jgi:predicted nucleic acid-binding protein